MGPPNIRLDAGNITPFGSVEAAVSLPLIGPAHDRTGVDAGGTGSSKDGEARAER